MPTDSNTDSLTQREPRSTVEASDLISWVKGDITDAQTLGLFYKLNKARRTRACWWPGKTPDGEYGNAPYGTRSTGLNKGALDHEVRVVDEQCNLEVDLAMHAFMRSEKIVRPRDAMNDDQTKRAEAWRHATEFYLDATDEEMQANVELFANCLSEMGQAVWYEGWKDHWRMGRKTITWDEILQSQMEKMTTEQMTPEQQAALQEQITQGMEMVRLDENAKATLVQMLQEYDPNISKPEAGRVAAAFIRNEPSVDYMAPIKTTALPVHRAYFVGVDCFYPAMSRSTSTDENGIPRMVFLEWYTEARLMAEAKQENWDKDFLKDVLDKGPGLAFDPNGYAGGASFQWELNGIDMGMEYNTTALKNAGLYQIATLWYWGVDKNGLPSPYRVILQPYSSTRIGKQECDPFKHGKMPWILKTRTLKRPLAVSSDGVAGEMLTNQTGRKKLEDAMVSQTELRANPPRVETSEMSSGGGLRPGAVMTISGRYLDKVGAMLMNVPDISAGSIRMLEWLKSEQHSYYLTGPDADPDAKRIRRFVQLAKWCAIYKSIIKLMCMNIQQNVSELTLGSVGGVEVNWIIKGEDLQGELDIVVRCDEGSVDFELAMKKLDAVMKILPLNQQGTLVTDEVLRRALTWIDPDMVRGGISTPQQAQDRIMKDENSRISQMCNGITISWDVQADAPQIRQQVLQDWINYPPNIQRVQSDQKLSLQFKNEQQWLAFAVSQQVQNPQTGRTGVDAQKMQQQLAQQQ